jgi:hypothetical protein
MMRHQLRVLVAVFNKWAAEYALARLEVSMQNGGSAAPPIVNRLGAGLPTAAGFAAHWALALTQMRAAATYVAAARKRASGVKKDAALRRLERLTGMLQHYADRIAWIGAESKTGAGEENR